jgi:hypothetical protein
VIEVFSLRIGNPALHTLEVAVEWLLPRNDGQRLKRGSIAPKAWQNERKRVKGRASLGRIEIAFRQQLQFGLISEIGRTPFLRLPPSGQNQNLDHGSVSAMTDFKR